MSSQVASAKVAPSDTALKVAAITLALGLLKVSLGLAIIVRTAMRDLDLTPPLVQTGSYFVILVAIVLQRRVGLALATAFVGYSLVTSISEFGLENPFRVAITITTFLLAVSLLINVALPAGRVPLSREFWPGYLLAIIVGLILGILVPLKTLSPSPTKTATDVSQFIPGPAKQQILLGLGVSDETIADCVIDKLAATFGQPVVMGWSATPPTAEEQAKIDEIASNCADES